MAAARLETLNHDRITLSGFTRPVFGLTFSAPKKCWRAFTSDDGAGGSEARNCAVSGSVASCAAAGIAASSAASAARTIGVLHRMGVTPSSLDLVALDDERAGGRVVGLVGLDHGVVHVDVDLDPPGPFLVLRVEVPGGGHGDAGAACERTDAPIGAERHAVEEKPDANVPGASGARIDDGSAEADAVGSRGPVGRQRDRAHGEIGHRHH